MLEQIAILLVTTVAMMVVGKRIAVKTYPSPVFGILLQTVLVFSCSYLLLTYASIGTIGGVLAVTLVPGFVSTLFVFLRTVKRNRALNGDFGDEAQWASELIIEENDEAFILATQALPKDEVREVGIIAESKEELRELTLERMDELAENEEMPEELQ
jgi:hypothetical protein